jgi:hypothetical protein
LKSTMRPCCSKTFINSSIRLIFLGYIWFEKNITQPHFERFLLLERYFKASGKVQKLCFSVNTIRKYLFPLAWPLVWSSP